MDTFKSIIDQWFNEVIDFKIPIFDLNNDRTIKTEVSKGEEVLKVTSRFKSYFTEKNELINSDSRCEGFLYFMYKLDFNRIIPLYFGRAEKKGSKVKLFQRWQNNKNSDHIFLLSSIVIKNKNKPKKYIEWKKALFDGKKLKDNVYLAIIPWFNTSMVPMMDIPVPLKTAEFLIIGIAGESYPKHLLNFEGRSRQEVTTSKIIPPITFNNIEDLWKYWSDQYLRPKAPLFDEINGLINTTYNGQFKVLKRSNEMETLVQKEERKIWDDFVENTNQYDGMIYLMFWERDGYKIPLYVGKAEKIGTKGGYSVNLKGIHRGGNKGKFARWGYGHQYHIGDLSHVIYDHDCYLKKPSKKYIRWRNKLFEPNIIDGKPKLKQPIYLWAKAWHRDDIGLFGLAHCSCTFLEYQLIGLAGLLYKEDLLNTDGI